MPHDPEEIHRQLETQILTKVNQPGQYVGNEPGTIRKEHDAVDVSAALCFPDTYSIGMSHLGCQILYDIVNEKSWALAERAYAPWPDMQAEMRGHDIPLFSVESFTPLTEFDLVGFTLQSEMLYSNILMMLDLAHIPLFGSERDETHPIIIAGGPGALAPEPLGDFIDVFFIGDGEESFPEFLGMFKDLKRKGLARHEILLEAARHIAGLYVPKFYYPAYRQEDGLLESIKPVVDGVPQVIERRVVKDLDSAPFPTNPIVPLVDTTHERINIEIMRGCGRGCRFCHAGMTNRPQRYKKPDTVLKQAKESYTNTGYDEIALTSLSSSDYPFMEELLKKLTDYFTPLSVSISLPSLRVSDQIGDLVGSLNAVRKSGLTIAPEAASERLRDLIRKDITNKDLFDGTAAAACAGWRLVKLYFMIGLPGETKDDIAAIGNLCQQVISHANKASGKKSMKLNVTISPFVPKPHTPLQWEAMESLEGIREKWEEIRLTGGRNLRYKLHTPEQSIVEAALARGDRRMGAVLLEAYRAGAGFDAWNDMFDFAIWETVFSHHGIDIANNDQNDPNSPSRQRSLDETLPWDHIGCGVDKSFMRKERNRAFNVK